MAQDLLVRFGVFEADLRAGELRRSGLRIHLQEQPFHILQMLLEHPGEIVTREQIRETLWPGEQYGDFDHAINVAVMKLRDALDDHAKNPQFVESMARRGYRFIAPVGGRVDAPLEQDIATNRSGSTRVSPQNRWKFLIGVAGLALIVFALVLLRRTPKPPHVYQPVAFTTMQGMISSLAFSPEGNEIAYVWQRSDSEAARIYLQAFGSVVSRPLTDDTEHKHTERRPRWFPDGHAIAYIRNVPGGPDEIWVVPRTGGLPRKLMSFNKVIGFDISPAGDKIVVSEYAGNDAAALFLVSMDGARRQLTWPENKPWVMSADKVGDRYPQFSPDGKKIAFLRLGGNDADLWLIELARGAAERLTYGTIANSYHVGAYVWEGDSRSLLISGWYPAGTPNQGLWRLKLPRKNWEALMLSDSADSPALSRDGKQLAFIQGVSSQNLWRYELPRTPDAAKEPINLTKSTASNDRPSYSPDGRRIAFGSDRTGHYEIYVSDADGLNLKQLTFFNANDAGAPNWSPDGKQIVFDYRPDKHVHIFLIDADGGPPKQITFGDNDNVLPRYSRDGKWIFSVRLRPGGTDLWKTPSGGGESAFVKADVWFLANDGDTLYYTKRDQIGVYRRTAEKAEEQLVIPNVGSMTQVRNGFCYRIPKLDGTGSGLFGYYDFQTGRSETLLEFPFRIGNGWAISRDMAYLVVTRREFQSNIMLVKDFR